MTNDEYSLFGLLKYRLIKTNKRLTFDIISQNPRLTFKGADDEDYFMFVASNGYQIISRSRMDIQTERIWLLGGTNDDIAERSGTMVFSSNEKRDRAFDNFQQALSEWADYALNNPKLKRLSDYVNKPNDGWQDKSVMPEAGRLIVKRWKNGAVWAGSYNGSAKDSSFETWRYIDV